MTTWTEVKCLKCARVCCEVPGSADDEIGGGSLAGVMPVVPGPHCTLVEERLQCSRCGGPIYCAAVYDVAPARVLPASRGLK